MKNAIIDTLKDTASFSGVNGGRATNMFEQNPRLLQMKKELDAEGGSTDSEIEETGVEVIYFTFYLQDI
jgi:hypothetical protein